MEDNQLDLITLNKLFDDAGLEWEDILDKNQSFMLMQIITEWDNPNTVLAFFKADFMKRASTPFQRNDILRTESFED